jgi:hypothetical protein
LPRIAACNAAERYTLLPELAGKLYGIHASKRIELVGPGHVEDCNDFDAEHAIQALLAVWHPLETVQFDDAERQAIERTIAGSRSYWLSEALKRVVAAGENISPPDGEPLPSPKAMTARSSRLRNPKAFRDDEGTGVQRREFIGPFLLKETLSGVATRSGVGYSSLYRWRSGETRLSPENRSKLADHLKST